MKRKRCINSVFVILLTLMFLVNASSLAFDPTIRTDSKSILNPSTDLKAKPAQVQESSIPSSGLQTGKQVPFGFQNFFGSKALSENAQSDSIRGFGNLAGENGEVTELVIGVNNTRPNAYTELVEAIGRSQGGITNTITMEKTLTALTASFPTETASAFIDEVNKGDLAEFVEPNLRFQTQLAPNDPYWNLQWGPKKIQADYAWNTTTGNSSVLVAVIDTGVDYDHPDISANYVALGHDWVNNDNYPMDDNGHGTHCAGIIAATLNNGIGIAGVAQVRVMAEKGLDSSGSGYEDDLANAIIHAVDQEADILSNSWGGAAESILIHEAVKYAHNHGVLVLAAAGNSASSAKLYPAAYDEVVAVTATDENDNLAYFSSYGDWVEVAAPGVSIYSTIWDNSYDYKSGTSMACPHAAAVAALIWSRFPNATRDWVREQLRYTANDLGDPGFDVEYGYGRVNARNAVERAPQEHDLLIFDWEKPRNAQPGKSASFNVTVLNFGSNDENNVTVQLLVDGNVADDKLIDSLPVGTTSTAKLSWTPATEQISNVTVYVVPVAGENTTENNVFSATITVRYAKYVLWDDVHDGDGDSLTGNYLSLYELLTSVGYVVDELTSGTINSGLLKDYDILVLIDPEYDFSLSEIDDVHDWVTVGGALIVIPDTGYPSTLNGIMAPYDVQLSGMRTIDYGTTTNIVPHAITWGIASIFYDLAWELACTPPCEILAWSTVDSYPFISVTDNNVVVLSDSNMMDNYGLPMADNTQLMINVFDFVGAKYEHELVAGLEAPQYQLPSETTVLNASVTNRGMDNETDVELKLLINGTLVANETIPELMNGTMHTLNYVWNLPNASATYNVTTYVPPVPNENLTLDNLYTRMVSVHYPLINPVEGQYANYILKYYDAGGNEIGQGYWNFTYGSYIEPYKIYIEFSIKDPSGYTGSGWMIVNTMTRLVEQGVWARYWYPGWIETTVNVGSTINLLSGTATVNGSKFILVGMHAVDCWDMPYYEFGYAYGFRYDKASGLWIDMETSDPMSGQRMHLLLEDTNVPIAMEYEHDLAVSLGAPLFLQPGNSSLLNVTVYNLGTSTENNVDVSLMIDSVEVEGETVPTLVNGTSYTFACLWTPVAEANYNVTAYVEPVQGEASAINNVVTRMIRVRLNAGYVLFDQTHYTDSTFSYSIWVNNLTDRGYIVDTLTTTPITPAVFEGYDIFVIPQAHDSYSTGELDAIQDFVLSGGALLVIGDDAPSIYSSLTNFAGITWSYYGYWGFTTDITPHPVTEGVRTAYFDSPGTLLVDLGAKSLIRDAGGNTVLAVSEIGKGEVVCIADENSIINGQIGYGDNLRLANNMIDWLESRYPLVSFSYVPMDPYVGETVTFDAYGSYDIDGIIVSYLWNFGDNATVEGIVAYHAFVLGGTSNVTLTVVDNEGLNSTCTKEIRILRTALDVHAKVGSIHFKGEIAEFYVLVSSMGKAIDANISATLYYNGDSFEDLTALAEHVSLGLYRIPYTIPTDASAGTYAMVVEASYSALKGTALESFLLSSTLTDWNAKLVSINDTVGTIRTDLGTIKVQLEAINATLSSVNGTIGRVETNLGAITVSLDAIDAKLVSIDRNMATINSTLGSIQTGLDTIQLKVTAINGTAATIQTTLGEMNGTIASIKGDMATILIPDVGQVETDISSLKASQEAWVIPQYLIIGIALIAAAGAVLSTVMLWKRKKTAQATETK